MIISTASVIFSIDDKMLVFDRSKAFKFWQWVSFFFSTAVLFSTALFLLKMNAEKVNGILQNDDLVSKSLLFGLGLTGIGVIGYLCVQSRKSTKNYILKLVDDEIYINSVFFCRIDEPKTILKIKNVGWRGLGISYTIGLQTKYKKRSLIYYLAEKEAAEVINLFERYSPLMAQD